MLCARRTVVQEGEQILIHYNDGTFVHNRIHSLLGTK